MRNIHVTLENTRLASEHLPATLHDVRDLVVDLRHATQEKSAASPRRSWRASRRKQRPDIKAAVANVRHITESLAATSDSTDHFLADNEPGISHFTNQSLACLNSNNCLRESRDAARDFRDPILSSLKPC